MNAATCDRTEQRLAALAKAKRVYHERALIKRDIRNGEISIVEAFEQPCCQSATVLCLLKSQWDWGEKTTHRWLVRMANRTGVVIGAQRRIRDLTPRQLSALREELR